MPLRTVRLETGASRVGICHGVLLLRCCPTESDRISRIVPTPTPRCQGPATVHVRHLMLNTLTFCRVGRQSVDQKGRGPASVSTTVASIRRMGRLMLARQRQAFILDRVREDGAVRVADLVRELGVSDMTVRRDLEMLDEQGLLEKVHGGATSIAGHRPVRARVRGQVGAPAAREGRHRRCRGRARRARHGRRGLGRDDDLRPGAAARAVPGADRRDQLDPGGRRPPPGRPRATRRSS